MEFVHEQGRIYLLGTSGSKVAEVTFPASNGVAVITNTYVHPSLRGQGVAGRLLEAAVEQIRAAGLKARLNCSYAAKWFDQHPEHHDLL